MKALKYLNKYLWKYRVRVVLGILCIIVSNGFNIIKPRIIREATDNITTVVDLPGSIQTEKIASLAFEHAGMYLLLALLSGLFLFFTRQTIIVMSRKIEADLKNEIYQKYQELSMSFYKKNNTGDLMNRISEDVGKVRMYLGPAIMYTINVTVLFCMIIVAMIRVDVELTLYVLTPLPILSITIYYISNIINKRSEEVQRQQSRLSTLVQEAFSGIRVVKAYLREGFESERFERESEMYKRSSLRLVKVNALFHPFIMLLIGFSTVLTIYIGGLKVMDPTSGLTLGNIAEFVMYVNMLTWPFASVGWVTSLIQRAAASQKRINEFLHTLPAIQNTNKFSHDVKGDIRFENVSFHYENSGTQALKNVSFEVKQGEVLAIIGRTGSGKSTISNLICRHYDVDTGRIFVDNKPIQELNLPVLRSSIGYVPQEVFLFSETIAKNIAFGKVDASQEEIEKAAKDAVVYDNIIGFPEKFDTMLGERGINLSGGQKQRVSIARAIIHNPKILIFDDCLSAVDTETEEQILRNLKPIMKGKTTLIISHRISSVKDADKIIVLREGEIIETGTHKELLKSKGYYFDLYRKQLLESQKNIV